MFTTWNAIPTLDRLFDDVMNDVIGAARGTAVTASTYSPSMDVRANDHELVFVCDVPGLKRENLEITVDARVLTIQGKRRYEGGEKDRVLLGRTYGAFSSRFTLPDDADVEHIEADLADGVLTVKVPKQPKPKPRQIAIGSGGHKELAENGSSK